MEGEDETACPPPPPDTCTREQMECISGGCATRCDGKSECYDAGDEINCCFDNFDQFVCKNGECIESNRECDGMKDCTDGSDEHSGCGKFSCNLLKYIVMSALSYCIFIS